MRRGYFELSPPSSLPRRDEVKCPPCTTLLVTGTAEYHTDGKGEEMLSGLEAQGKGGLLRSNHAAADSMGSW